MPLHAHPSTTDPDSHLALLRRLVVFGLGARRLDRRHGRLDRLGCRRARRRVTRLRRRVSRAYCRFDKDGSWAHPQGIARQLALVERRKRDHPVRALDRKASEEGGIEQEPMGGLGAHDWACHAQRGLTHFHGGRRRTQSRRVAAELAVDAKLAGTALPPLAVLHDVELPPHRIEQLLVLFARDHCTRADQPACRCDGSTGHAPSCSLKSCFGSPSTGASSFAPPSLRSSPNARFPSLVGDVPTPPDSPEASFGSRAPSREGRRPAAG